MDRANEKVRLRRRRVVVCLAVAGLIGVSACASSAPSRAEQPVTTQDSADDEFADCVFPTFPNGTYLDENGAPASAPAHSAEPPPTRSPAELDQPSGPTVPAEPEVALNQRSRAQDAAEADPLLGPLLRKGMIKEALQWLGADEQPIGIILDYSFNEPSSLPMGHGAIIDAGSTDAGRAGQYETNGLPSKASLPKNAQDRDTTRAFIFIVADTWQVYAAQEMNVLDDPPC